MYFYYLYNIRVNSEILLPGLENGTIKDLYVNKEIFICSYEKNNFVPEVSEVNKRVRDDTEIFFEKEYLVMRYKQQWEMAILKNGKGIYIKENCEDIGQALSVLLGTGLSILMLYNGYIPLHAGSFEFRNRAVTVVGYSGVGKSSFIRYAIENGYKMITEDTLPIFQDEDKLIAYPSISIKSKLGEEAIKHFDIKSECIGEQINKTKKYWISVTEKNRYYTPIEIERIYFLEPNYKYSNIEMYQLSFEEKKRRIIESINSINDLPIFDTKIILKKIYEMLSRIDAYMICYPMGLENFPKLMKYIISNEEIC